MISRPSRLTRTAQSLVVRSGSGMLAPVWRLLYRLTARLVGAVITRGEAAASVYARAGTGSEDIVPGLSDIDLTVVVSSGPEGGAAAAQRVRERFARFQRLLPTSAGLVELPCVYDERELVGLAGSSYATFGLEDGPTPPPAFVHDPSLLDRRRILERPGLDNAVRNWRRIAGPERRPAVRGQDADARSIAAWLELAFWWRSAFAACRHPDAPHIAFLCVKLVAEPARIWLWLSEGERFSRRRDVLERALVRLPEEEVAIRAAMDLERRLHERPSPPLESALSTLVRLSSRIASHVNRGSLAPEATEVRLLGARPAELTPAIRLDSDDGTEWSHPDGAIPLCDWRAIATSTHADESFVELSGDPGDPVAVTRAAAARLGGTYGVLRAPELLVFPLHTLDRPLPRFIACEASDPTSFALSAGGDIASFPPTGGWSLRDTARRAVAEQTARFDAKSAGRTEGAELRGLLCAARAALLLESVDAGEPVLPVTVAATARRLAERAPTAQTIAEDAAAALASSERASPATLAALRGVVAELLTRAA